MNRKPVGREHIALQSIGHRSRSHEHSVHGDSHTQPEQLGSPNRGPSSLAAHAVHFDQLRSTRGGIQAGVAFGTNVPRATGRGL
jgi:hypothetical protein